MMRHGPGVHQQSILAALAKTDYLIPLGGRTRTERDALTRAANALERAGRCVVVHLWNDDHTALCAYVARADATCHGEPIKTISVPPVP